MKKKCHLNSFWWKNSVAETSIFKFSQLAAGEKIFGKNTVAETSLLNEERKLSLRRVNLKFNFFWKNEKKNNTETEYFTT